MQNNSDKAKFHIYQHINQTSPMIWFGEKVLYCKIQDGQQVPAKHNRKFYPLMQQVLAVPIPELLNYILSK